jgi:hypothetical protein
MKRGAGMRLGGYNDAVVIGHHMQQQQDDFEVQSPSVRGEER